MFAILLSSIQHRVAETAVVVILIESCVIIQPVSFHWCMTPFPNIQQASVQWQMERETLQKSSQFFFKQAPRRLACSPMHGAG